MCVRACMCMSVRVRVSVTTILDNRSVKQEIYAVGMYVSKLCSELTDTCIFTNSGQKNAEENCFLSTVD